MKQRGIIMIILELLMVVIGLAAVVASFRLAEGNGQKAEENTDTQNQRYAGPDFSKEIAEEMAKAAEKLKEQAEQAFDEIDGQLSKLSNDKIMGMSEYSDQVLDKIEKNHAEVVFLYDMMGEKQEEIKKLIAEADSLRADIHDEAAKEYQKLKEQETALNELCKQSEVASMELKRVTEKSNHVLNGADRRQENPYDAGEDMDILRNLLEEKDDPEDFRLGFDTDAKNSLYDAEIARIEEEEKSLIKESGNGEGEQKRVFGTKDTEFSQVDDSGDVPELKEIKTWRSRKRKVEPVKAQNTEPEVVNHNNEIISLYKKGRSVMDISKMLSIGQGEVKFVIDLFNAR